MIKMYHDDPKATGGPVEADVPEEGVAMMRKAGWHTREPEEKHQPAQDTPTEAPADEQPAQDAPRRGRPRSGESDS